MKLNKGDKVRYNDRIYETVAVIWSTVYLRAMDCENSVGCYDLQDIYGSYRDIEFIEN